MNNINKLFKLTDLMTGVSHYSKQLLEGLQPSTLSTLQLFRAKHLPNGMNEFVRACVADNSLHQFMQESGLLDGDNCLNDPLKIMVLKSILDMPIEQDLLTYFFENNPINDKYFPEDVLQKLRENYEAFLAGDEQVHVDYRIYRMPNVYEQFHLACIDTARDWSMFSKKKTEGVVEHELSYKIFVSADSFMSSVHNYILYSSSQLLTNKDNVELVVVPILGCINMQSCGKEIYVQVIPHVYKKMETPMGTDEYMKIRYRSTDEKDAEINSLQIKFQLPERIIEQRLCSFASDTISEPVKTCIPKMNYTIEMYHEQALVIDIGTVLDSTNKYDLSAHNVDATQWDVVL